MYQSMREGIQSKIQVRRSGATPGTFTKAEVPMYSIDYKGAEKKIERTYQEFQTLQKILRCKFQGIILPDIVRKSHLSFLKEESEQSKELICNCLQSFINRVYNTKELKESKQVECFLNALTFNFERPTSWGILNSITSFFKSNKIDYMTANFRYANSPKIQPPPNISTLHSKIKSLQKTVSLLLQALALFKQNSRVQQQSLKSLFGEKQSLSYLRDEQFCKVNRKGNEIHSDLKGALTSFEMYQNQLNDLLWYTVLSDVAGADSQDFYTYNNEKSRLQENKKKYESNLQKQLNKFIKQKEDELVSLVDSFKLEIM